MTAPYRDHPDEDALERFLLNQSEEEELEVVETHIMACEACVTRMETLELRISATKLALQSLQSEEAKKLTSASHNDWKSWFTLPRLSWVGAAAAACAVILTVASVPSNVTLTAYRGSETNVVKEFRPLQLRLNATDIPAGTVIIEVVDSQGRKVWQGKSTAKEDRVDVKVPRLTKAGIYYLRVFAASANDVPGEVEREFSLKVEPLF